MPPEGAPTISNITHNSATLSWLSPKGLTLGGIIAYRVEIFNVREGRWKNVTKTCQGSCYTVRNLAPNTQYKFRVRAESINGISKHSGASEVIRTRSFEPSSEDDSGFQPKKKLVRRHSHHIRLEGGIVNILNRTEQSQETNSLGGIPLRRNSLRMSLPILSRRKSVTSMLPGSKRESICSLKEEFRYSIEQDEATKIKRISSSTEEGSSIRSLSATSLNSLPADGETDDLEDFKDTSSVDSGVCRKETDLNIEDLSADTLKPQNCDILCASVSDDTKLASLTNTDDVTNDSQCVQGYSNSGLWKSRSFTDRKDSSYVRNPDTSFRNTRTLPDLRSLRNMLNSHEVMVKTLNSENHGCHYAHNVFRQSRENELTTLTTDLAP